MTGINQIFFFKGKDDVTEQEVSEDDSIEKIRKSFEKVLDGKHLSFLLGSGCSSFMVISDPTIEENEEEEHTEYILKQDKSDEIVLDAASDPLHLTEDHEFDQSPFDFEEAQEPTNPSNFLEEISQPSNDQQEIDSTENNVLDVVRDHYNEVGIPTMMHTPIKLTPCRRWKLTP